VNDELRQLLLVAPIPDELEAQRRTWNVVRAAYAAREPAGRPIRRLRPLLALAAVAALVLAAAVTPVGGWLREQIGTEDELEPALVRLPGPASQLLVVSERGPWIVQTDGSKRLLGDYDDASCSPSGSYLVVTEGQRITAVEPDGDARWSLTKEQRLTHPRWAPSGYRVAYHAGNTLRVVAGDGRPDRLLVRGVAPVAVAWLPERERNVLAYADRAGRVHVVNADTGRRLWRTEAQPRVRELLWSADGVLLVLTAGRRSNLYREGGRLAGLVNEPVTQAAFAPEGRALAYTTRTGDRAFVRLRNRGETRTLFEGAGQLGDVAWSPNGRWLLAGWPAPDQWLFLRVPEVNKVETVEDVRREFDPGGEGVGSFPRVAGWCPAP
jgi:PQQ enzyme repeat